MTTNEVKVCLYILTHNNTGLKYFGKTINSFTIEDIVKYGGSGKYWKYHLGKYGKDISAEIYGIYNLSEVKPIALKFSKDNNILEARNDSGDRKGKKIWANLELEDGLSGFSKRTNGLVCAFDTKTNEYKQVKCNELKEDSTLKGTTSGQVTVLDNVTNTYKNISKEEYNNGSYKIHSTGYVNCIDTRTNKTMKVTKEEYNKHEYLQNPMKGKLPVIDIITGKKLNVTKEEYTNNSNYISINSEAPVAFYDLENKVKGLCSKEDFIKNSNYISPVSKWRYITYNDKNEIIDVAYGTKTSLPKYLFNALKKANLENKEVFSNITKISNSKWKYKKYRMEKEKISKSFFNDIKS